MSTDIKVEIEHLEPVRAWLAAVPSELRAADYATVEEGTQAAANAIAANTPVRTGALLASERTSVVKTFNGARGTIMSNIRYARFVEAGTREHGRAQRMFARGGQLTRRGIENIADRNIGAVVKQLR